MSEGIQVSLFASSVRPQLYEAFFESLEGTSVNYEVVFAGPRWLADLDIYESDKPVWCLDAIDDVYHGISWPSKYIHTANLKPAQCYEIARRHCKGEVVVWVADDCEFPNDVIGKAYKYWKAQENEKLILSIQTIENGLKYNMQDHCLFWMNRTTPMMAPIGMMSRKWLDEMGGLDARYLCGQYENDIIMRAYSSGGKVEVFGDRGTAVHIQHMEKHGKDTKFWTGYEYDRKILEASWKDVDFITSFNRHDEFCKFEDDNILTKSQKESGSWE